MSRTILDHRPKMAQSKLSRISHVVMVCSAKGGVGKTTVAAGIAMGLSNVGRKVGLLDLDLQGTSMGRMLRIEGPMSGDRFGLNPLTRDGIKVMSISMQTGGETLPVRGQASEDLVAGLLSQVNWGELDYLIVDMPPGMGEELLSFLRMAWPSPGALLVTTPSALSVEVVRRLASLLREEKVKLLGLVENMSYFSCRCGEIIRPFGSGSESELIGLELLARLPIDPDLERAFSRGSSLLDAKLLGKELVQLARIVDQRAHLSAV